jgi:hypothetical protein
MAMESDKVFAGSVPENYDRYMAPLIFESYASDLAQRAASLSPSAVLVTTPVVHSGIGDLKNAVNASLNCWGRSRLGRWPACPSSAPLRQIG